MARQAAFLTRRAGKVSVASTQGDMWLEIRRTRPQGGSCCAFPNQVRMHVRGRKKATSRYVRFACAEEPPWKDVVSFLDNTEHVRDWLLQVNPHETPLLEAVAEGVQASLQREVSPNVVRWHSVALSHTIDMAPHDRVGNKARELLRRARLSWMRLWRTTCTLLRNASMPRLLQL